MQPPAYVRQTNFASEEATGVAGRSTVRTGQVDAELNAAKATLDAILVNLALIQRDDGQLRDAVVTIASLSSAVLLLLGSTGLTFRGAWLTATIYAYKDVVTNGNGTYVCAVAHTSGTFATDLAASKWVQIFNSTTFSAAGISFAPGSGISSVNVQAAVEEVATVTQAGAGAVARQSEVKVLEIVSAKDFGAVGNGVADDTTAVQNALTYANANNLRLYFPPGIYLVTSGLIINGVAATKVGKSVVIEGAGANVDGDTAETVLKWGGTSNLANTLFKANGQSRFVCKGIAFSGGSKVGKVFYATQNVGTSYAPFGWGFEDCVFELALSGGYGFYVDTSTNCARFNFVRCIFQAGTGCKGYYSVNPNAVSQSFIACGFSYNDYGIHINGGSFSAYSCEFGPNALADNYLQVHGNINFVGCWSEQSRQFLITDFRTQYSPVALDSCQISSFPWSYWKLDEAGRAQPTNDFSQWISILWDGDRGALNLINTKFVDPYNGAVAGAIAPTTAQVITVSATNGTNNKAPKINNVGSFSQNGTDSFTEQFYNHGTNQLAAPRIARTKRYQDFGNFSGAGAPTPHVTSTAELTLTGNATLTFNTNHVDAEDEYTLVVKQDATGGRLCEFAGPLEMLNGYWRPDPTPSAKSSITFRFNGTNWVEMCRSGNTAGPTKRPYLPAIVWTDDFMGDVIADQWNTRVGSDGACVAAAVLANQARGLFRMVTGAGAGATYAVNGTQLDAQLNWQANQGGLMCEFRVLLSAITNVALFIGLTDQVAALEMPATLAAGDALTTNFTDGCGVLFDTGADTDNWWLIGVANDVDATKQNSAVAPVAGTMETWRIEITAAGVATFFRNGTQVGTAMTGAVTPTIPLTPVVAAFARAAASRNVDGDYIAVQANR